MLQVHRYQYNINFESLRPNVALHRIVNVEMEAARFELRTTKEVFYENIIFSHDDSASGNQMNFNGIFAQSQSELTLRTLPNNNQTDQRM